MILQSSEDDVVALSEHRFWKIDRNQRITVWTENFAEFSAKRRPTDQPKLGGKRFNKICGKKKKVSSEHVTGLRHSIPPILYRVLTTLHRGHLSDVRGHNRKPSSAFWCCNGASTGMDCSFDSSVSRTRHQKHFHQRHLISHSRHGDSRDVPTMTHDEIVDRRLTSSEPAGRSALQNFERLGRHVALWEYACRGQIVYGTSYSQFKSTK